MIQVREVSFSSVSVVLNALRLRRFRATAVAEAAPCPPCQINETENTEMKKQMQIDGMMCEHCKAHVIRALSALDGVVEVDVDLAAKTATVAMANEIPNEKLTETIAALGFEPGEITTKKGLFGR